MGNETHGNDVSHDRCTPNVTLTVLMALSTHRIVFRIVSVNALLSNSTRARMITLLTIDHSDASGCK